MCAWKCDCERGYEPFAYENDMSESQNITLAISGMNCEHCRMHVKKAIEQFDFAQDVRVDLQQGKAYFAIADAATDVNRVIEAIAEAGYSAALF